jgi:hypothetical protein
MRSLVLFVVATLMFACDMETVVRKNIPNDGQRLVVNSVLIPGEEISVSVVASRHILDDSYVYEVPANTSVKITGSEGVTQTLFYNSSTMLFSSPGFVAEEGVNYTIEVTAPGYRPVSSSTFVKVAVPIKRIEKGGMTTIDDDTRGVQYRLYFDDIPNEKNYYRISVENIGDIYSTDPAISNDYRSLEELFFKDDLISGPDHYINVVIPDYHTNQQLIFHLDNMSEAFYRYVETTALQSYVEDDPFAEPVVVFNNIRDGYGIFGSYSASVMEFTE